MRNPKIHPAGFEPALPKETELKSVALDPSAKDAWFFGCQDTLGFSVEQKSDRNVIAVCVFKKSPAGFEPAALRLHCRHRDDALKSLMLYRLS